MPAVRSPGSGRAKPDDFSGVDPHERPADLPGVEIGETVPDFLGVEALETEAVEGSGVEVPETGYGAASPCS